MGSLPDFHRSSASVIPGAWLIAPCTLTITPSSDHFAYLLTTFAQLCVPEPYVHLVSLPLNVELDARLTRNES